MRVSLGKFACSCIKARFGGEVATVVEMATADYAEQLELPTRSSLVPRFWLEREPSETTLEFDVAVSPWKRQVFETEARKQGLLVEQLLTHAVFVYLAAGASVANGALAREDVYFDPLT